MRGFSVVVVGIVDRSADFISNSNSPVLQRIEVASRCIYQFTVKTQGLYFHNIKGIGGKTKLVKVGHFLVVEVFYTYVFVIKCLICFGLYFNVHFIIILSFAAFSNWCINI